MNKLAATLLLLIALGGLTQVKAQAPGSTGPAPAPASTNAPANVPLDGGASLLLAGGAAYGLRRLRQLRRRA